MLGTNLYSHLPPGNRRVWHRVTGFSSSLSHDSPCVHRTSHFLLPGPRSGMIRERWNNKYQQIIDVDKCGWKRDEKSPSLELHFVFATTSKWQVSTLLGTRHYSACLMSLQAWTRTQTISPGFNSNCPSFWSWAVGPAQVSARDFWSECICGVLIIFDLLISVVFWKHLAKVSTPCGMYLWRLCHLSPATIFFPFSSTFIFLPTICCG